MKRVLVTNDDGIRAEGLKALEKGLAHLELGEKAQAMVELNYVVNQFPGSDEAKSARQRLKALGGDAR